MASTAELMREIHRLRRFARDLQEQIERAPQQLKVQKARVVRQEDAARENHEAIKKLKVTAHEKEVTLRTTHAQIAKHQAQLNAAASKKEYDALQTEIAADREKVGQLEEEILTAMTETDERVAKIQELEQAARSAKEEFARYESESGARLSGLKQQLDETQARLTAVEADVPAKARTDFERLVRGKGVEAFASVADRSCAACRTEITAQQYNDLLTGSFVKCKSCGRILYLPEASHLESEDSAR
jgi:predicted  nucleic acid-binding Zn-ribbon protein